MELVTLSKNYREFYAPAYSVRLRRDDLMRDLLVAVSQLEINLVLGAASRFSFTVSNSYSHKLSAFKTGRVSILRCARLRCIPIQTDHKARTG